MSPPRSRMYGRHGSGTMGIGVSCGPMRVQDECPQPGGYELAEVTVALAKEVNRRVLAGANQACGICHGCPQHRFRHVLKTDRSDRRIVDRGIQQDLSELLEEDQRLIGGTSRRMAKLLEFLASIGVTGP